MLHNTSTNTSTVGHMGDIHRSGMLAGERRAHISWLHKLLTFVYPPIHPLPREEDLLSSKNWSVYPSILASPWVLGLWDCPQNGCSSSSSWAIKWNASGHVNLCFPMLHFGCSSSTFFSAELPPICFVLFIPQRRMSTCDDEELSTNSWRRIYGISLALTLCLWKHIIRLLLIWSDTVGTVTSSSVCLWEWRHSYPQHWLMCPKTWINLLLLLLW